MLNSYNSIVKVKEKDERKYVFKTYQNQTPKDKNYSVIDNTILDIINWMQDIRKRKK